MTGVFEAIQIMYFHVRTAHGDTITFGLSTQATLPDREPAKVTEQDQLFRSVSVVFIEYFHEEGLPSDSDNHPPVHTSFQAAPRCWQQALKSLGRRPLPVQMRVKSYPLSMVTWYGKALLIRQQQTDEIITIQDNTGSLVEIAFVPLD